MLLPLSLDLVTTDDISTLYKEDVEVRVLRLDKVHPFVSGNKWFKLRFYIEQAKTLNKKGIITFGGAWSNHIVATAAACQLNGLSSIGVIRGEQAVVPSTTLGYAKEMGMQLIFISREEYREKRIPSTLNLSDYLLIPEGGYGELGAKGASTLLDYCSNDYTHYCCAVGTGTMMAGLINRVNETQQVLGICVLKNNSDLQGSIANLATKAGNWQLLHNYHFGGYARFNSELIDFMNEFYKRTSVPSDFVYTAKLFYAIDDLIKSSFFKAGSRILLVHSGGLQGNSSLAKGTLIF